MSGQLTSTLTSTMETINVQEACTENFSGNTETKDTKPQCTENDHHSDSMCSTAAQSTTVQTEMETGNNQTDTDCSVKQNQASLDNDQNSATSRINQFERKCFSLDEKKLRKNQREAETCRRKALAQGEAEKLREAEMEKHQEAAARIGASNSKPVPQFFVKDWEFVQTLGEGAYGEVRLAYNAKNQEAVAVKIISLEGRKSTAADEVRKEVCIHRMLNHKNIIRFYGVRKEGNIQYLFLQYASGGELFDRIEPDVGMPQAAAQTYFRQLIDGLEYLHTKGVAHRDIKPENLLLDEKDNLKIADFGLATVFRYQGRWRYLERLCGSAPYLAPEVITLIPYQAEPADIWSSGLVLVAMLCGELPWDAAILESTDYVNWRECHIENRPWNKIDNLALCLLRRVLVEKPDKRYTIEQIRKNQWFKKDFSADAAKQLSAGPKRRRNRGSESEQSPRGVSCSQPNMSCTSSDSESSRSFFNKTEAQDDSAAEGPICFSQPTQADNMLLSSQLNGTQSSQTPMQKLVRRMTRFFCKQTRGEVMEELNRVFTQLGYSWKHSTSHMLTVHTLDRRQSQLTFKAIIVEMGKSLLLDFRLSKGDGLEFKRQFVRIRELMKSIICKVPTSWPNLPNL